MPCLFDSIATHPFSWYNADNLSGGQFPHVRVLYVTDTVRPFEHEFFLRISRSEQLIFTMQTLFGWHMNI